MIYKSRQRETSFSKTKKKRLQTPDICMNYIEFVKEVIFITGNIIKAKMLCSLSGPQGSTPVREGGSSIFIKDDRFGQVSSLILMFQKQLLNIQQFKQYLTKLF